MNKLKDNLSIAVAGLSLIGVVAAWATIPHRVDALEKRVDEYDSSKASIQVIEERTKIMQQDLLYMRQRIDDIAKPRP